MVYHYFLVSFSSAPFTHRDQGFVRYFLTAPDFSSVPENHRFHTGVQSLFHKICGSTAKTSRLTVWADQKVKSFLADSFTGQNSNVMVEQFPIKLHGLFTKPATGSLSHLICVLSKHSFLVVVYLLLYDVITRPGQLITQRLRRQDCIAL